MPYLIIDTSSERGIIAYGSSQEILFEKELPFGLNQSKFLLPLLTEALKPYGPIPQIEAIGCGIGPGSYTGIRIGVAVAQALAYSWKIPLIGIGSLLGFIPFDSSAFAAVMDARIGGLYYQKGKKMGSDVIFEGKPHVCSLEEARTRLTGVTHFVTPHMKSLKEKLKMDGLWEEKGPSSLQLLKCLENKHLAGEFIFPPEHLHLLYLRETEAEREKMRK